MLNITFSKQEKEILTQKIQRYFDNELEQEIGQFDAEFLLDFFSQQIGPYYYNQGLYDARVVIENRMESVTEAIYEIEKPTEFSR